jgi:hypothetical protein
MPSRFISRTTSLPNGVSPLWTLAGVWDVAELVHPLVHELYRADPPIVRFLYALQAAVQEVGPLGGNDRCAPSARRRRVQVSRDLHERDPPPASIPASRGCRARYVCV